MVVYRKSMVSDSCQIAKIHSKSFPNFFLTTLGYAFLKNYYESCIKNKEVVSISAIDDNTNILIGFSVGCYSSRGFNKKLVFSNLWGFSKQALILLYKNPIALIRLAKNFVKKNNSIDDGKYAELLSIGVSPDNIGLGVGKNLLTKFEDKIRERGVKIISLTTDAFSNDTVLKFYKKCGYECYYNFVTFPNREMLRLIKTLK